MTTFVYKIVSLPAYPAADNETDVVFQVNWTCTATDGAYSAVTAGSVPVVYEAEAPFIPYADLTQEQVWAWVDPQIDRAEVEANLELLIEQQKNPTVVVNPLPWA